MQPLLLTAVEEGLPTCAGSANGVHAFRSTQAHWLHHRLGSIQVAAHVVPHQMLQSRAHACTRSAWTMASPPAQKARRAGAGPPAPRLTGCITGWAPFKFPRMWSLTRCCSRARMHAREEHGRWPPHLRSKRDGRAQLPLHLGSLAASKAGLQSSHQSHGASVHVAVARALRAIHVAHIPAVATVTRRAHVSTRTRKALPHATMRGVSMLC